MAIYDLSDQNLKNMAVNLLVQKFIDSGILGTRFNTVNKSFSEFFNINQSSNLAITAKLLAEKLIDNIEDSYNTRFMSAQEVVDSIYNWLMSVLCLDRAYTECWGKEKYAPVLNYYTYYKAHYTSAVQLLCEVNDIPLSEIYTDKNQLKYMTSEVGKDTISKAAIAIEIEAPRELLEDWTEDSYVSVSLKCDDLDVSEQVNQLPLKTVLKQDILQAIFAIEF